MTSAAVWPAMPSPAHADLESESGFSATESAGTEIYSARAPAPRATLAAGTAPQTTAPTASSTGQVAGMDGPRATTVPQKSRAGVGRRRKGRMLGIFFMYWRSARLRDA